MEDTKDDIPPVPVTPEAQNSKVGYDYEGRIDEEYPLIIWKDPAVSKKTFEEGLKGFKSRLNISEHDIIYCKDCDNGLLKLSGPGPMEMALLAGKTATGPSTSKPMTRLHGLHYSSNYICKYPTSSFPEPGRKGTFTLNNTGYKNKAITAAIFDSGLALDMLPLAASSLAKIPSLCKPEGNQGWNFVHDNRETNDDYDRKHGTIVTNFIVEQENEADKEAQVVPVKTHNELGEGNLFQILCGIAYAAKAGVKVINASFGYYSPGKNVDTILFKKYIKYYLTKNNILLICAAGNEDKAADDAFKSSHPGKNPRNLGINHFYPACFSKTLPNVITVTTVNSNDNTVSPEQNYSSQFVDIGVNCDDASDKDCKYLFDSPLATGGRVSGSSFATPIVTGKICSQLDATTSYNKASIITQMCREVPGLKRKLKNGMVLL